jgi:transposase
VVKHITAGNFRYVAAGAAGISQRTFNAWIRRGKDEPGGPHDTFLQAIQKAEKTAEIAAVALASSGDPKNAQWWLERKFPQRWGRVRWLEAECRRLMAELEKERKRADAGPTAPPA